MIIRTQYRCGSLNLFRVVYVQSLSGRSPTHIQYMNIGGILASDRMMRNTRDDVICDIIIKNTAYMNGAQLAQRWKRWCFHALGLVTGNVRHFRQTKRRVSVRIPLRAIVEASEFLFLFINKGVVSKYTQTRSWTVARECVGAAMRRQPGKVRKHGTEAQAYILLGLRANTPFRLNFLFEQALKPQVHMKVC